MSDAESVAKAGNAVVAGLTKANQLPPWPDMHESLLELHAILAQWRDAAAATEHYVRHRLHTPEGLVAPAQSSQSPPAGTTNLISRAAWVGDNVIQTRDFVGGIMFDGKEILTPGTRFITRWSRARRRVARRGLRTLLRVYAPDLLSQVESAMTNRADWVYARHDGIERWLSVSHSAEEAEEFLTGMKATYSDLARTTDAVAAFICRAYPIAPAASETQPPPA